MTKSTYADRDTVGTIALKASQLNERVVVGDMAHELLPQLVDDINEAIASNPFDNRPFYILIDEKKDLLLTNMVRRRVLKQEFRPYPEPNSQVYWTNPVTNETLFCWSLPHQTSFQNYLDNARKYSKEQIKDILAYQYERMDHFGFFKFGETEKKVAIYYPLPGFKDRKLDYSKKYGK